MRTVYHKIIGNATLTYMTFPPETHALSLVPGATFQLRIVIYNDTAGTVPKDLTGYSAQMVVHSADGVPLLTVTNTDAITLGGTDGTIDIEIEADNTATIDWSYGLYYLSITSPDEIVDIILRGPLKIIRV